MQDYSLVEVGFAITGFLLFFLAFVVSTLACSRSTERGGQTDYLGYLLLTFKWPYLLSWIFLLAAVGIFILGGRLSGGAPSN